MAEIYMVKRQDGSFSPADQQSLEHAAKLKVGQVYRHEVKKPRNYKFHQKYFTLLNFVFDNQDKYIVFEPFRDAVTMGAGWYKTHISLNGTVIYSPKSISFANMEDVYFNKLYDKTITVILHNFLDCEREDLLEMVLNYA